MIKFISGKPGGGKTLYAVSIIEQVLVSTSDYVVTNIPINIGNLQDLLLSKGFDIHVPDRLRILTEEETSTFWRHRGPVDLPSEEREGVIDFTFLGEKITPVTFLIDEIHLFFNSREWMKTGKTAIRYLSQHRHLGDTVYCITQSITNVDKQFRALAQDFTYLRNYRVESWGYFKAPNKFTATTFLQPATDTTQPVDKTTFQLDVKGLASCYNTTGGVGMPGTSSGDKGKRSKGLPAWSFFAIAVAVAGFIYFLSVSGLKAVSKPATAAVTKLTAPPSSPLSVKDSQSTPPLLTSVYSNGSFTRTNLSAPVKTTEIASLYYFGNSKFASSGFVSYYPAAAISSAAR